jgi:hypothetical protein
MKNSIAFLISLFFTSNIHSQNVIYSSSNEKNNRQSAGDVFFERSPNLSNLFNKISRIYGSGKYGSGSGVVAEVTKTGNSISLCNISGAAGESTFMNINCVDLVKFEELEGEYDLIFEGPISKMKDHYSIDKSIINGKIVSTINRSGKTSQNGTISFVLRISKKTSFFYYKFCLLDLDGNPDCGMGTYQGELNYNLKPESPITPKTQKKKTSKTNYRKQK